MISLNCMKLADCFSPKELVEEIFRQCPDLKAPIPIKKIAEAVGITHIMPMPSENVEGMLVADGAKSVGVIYFKEQSLLGRQRFTIGHELGHFLLLHHGANQSCKPIDVKIVPNSNTIKEVESEANQFSELLLMPSHLVSSSINRHPLTMELLKDISTGFEMSFEAMANKCAKLCNTPFALIYSKNGVIRYCWNGEKKFPFWIPFKRNDLMPSSSQAIRLPQPEETISSSVEVDPAEWISVNQQQCTPRLMEQTYTQKNGYQVTMLRVQDS